MHTKESITNIVKEICKIKNINSKTFSNKLNLILLKGNAITKYKNELAELYKDKIDINNREHSQMLYEIFYHFKPEEKNIKEIDQRWRKNFFIIYI
jgi:hypothetical protein